MRFESMLWAALALFLMGGAGWSGDSLVGGTSGPRDYEAADGGSMIPPPIMDPGIKITPPQNVDGGSMIPPPTGP